jgi:N-acyl-L-homoserine lactone synthetase
LIGQAAMHMVECFLECSLNCPRFHILTVTTLFWNKRLRTYCVFLSALLGLPSQYKNKE